MSNEDWKDGYSKGFRAGKQPTGDQEKPIMSVEKYTRAAKAKTFMFRPFWQHVYRVTSREWLGNNVPPLTDRKILEWDIHPDKSQWDNRAYSVASLIEDGHEVWFGYHNQWRWHMSRKTFNKVIRNYIFIQVWYNWFGLRNWLYFTALHNIVQKRIKSQVKE